VDCGKARLFQLMVTPYNLSPLINGAVEKERGGRETTNIIFTIYIFPIHAKLFATLAECVKSNMPFCHVGGIVIFLLSF
jgi:hypothetical protein